MNIYSIGDLTKYIKSRMDDDMVLRNVYARGEISNFKNHFSGHCYFTLKDRSASMRCVMFKSRAQNLKFIPKDGMKAVAGGNITVFERDGQYQLYVNSLAPEGVGELRIAFEQLKEKLAAEGLFDEEHKQTLPLLPKTIGIVTSATGAVLRDIFTVVKRRSPQIGLRLYPVQVQGDGAARQIAAGIRFFNERYPVDILIVGRGGGSIEDLWPFNEECLVREIFRSRIPVVSAVGHETDYTLADFVGDVRAATPSQAAELAAPDTTELARYVGNLRLRLDARVKHRIESFRARLERCQSSPRFKNPQLLLADKRQLADYRAQRLRELGKALLIAKRHRMEILLEKLDMLSPTGVLRRGYGIARGTDGAVVRRAADVQTGQALEVFLSEGSLHVSVTGRGKGLKNG